MQMYSLLSGLYKHIVRKDEYYVLILGLDNAGKTVCENAALCGYAFSTTTIH